MDLQAGALITATAAGEEGVSEQPRRRGRGRPKGSCSRVIRDDRKLGLHHFSFVRSGLLGLDLRAAHERYLGWSDTNTDLRHIEHRYTTLLGTIRATLSHLASSGGDATNQAIADLTPPKPKARQQLPSLDDWVDAEGLDRDFYSEAELLVEYNVAHGVDNPDAAEAAEEAGWQDSQGRAVKALNSAERLLAARPALTDCVTLWFAAPVARRLHAVGIATVGDIVNAVNTRGRRWWRRSGIGARRGQQVVRWLMSEREALNADIRPSAYEVIVRTDEVMARTNEVIMPPRFGLVPLERLAVPHELSGRAGVFRANTPNTLGAMYDREAVEAWLLKHRERASTLRSYRKEAERFLLWCLLVLRKPLSSVTSPDCLAYRSFLSDIPASWVNGMPASRHDAMWRPFRGQLNPSSQKQSLVIIQALFEGLVAAGYLIANPLRSVMASFNLPSPGLQVQRSFSEAEVRHLRAMIEAEPAGPFQRRLRAMLELLLATGIRLDELSNAAHRDLRQVDVDGEVELAWVLTVIGKRRKRREVPVPMHIVEFLKAHEADLKERAVSARPLIASLAPAPGGQGAYGGALSAAGIYGTLKRFLWRCSLKAVATGLDAEHLTAASTHWLRHTFGRCAAVAGVPLEVIGQALGHASLTTTSIYLTQERSRMVRELRRMA